MAGEVRSIDTLVRAIGRDAAYLRLAKQADRGSLARQISSITNWLDVNHVGWERVYDFHPDHFVIEGTPTCIYIDADPQSERMAAVKSHFVSGDGKTLMDGAALNTLSLSIALEHSERDDPDFWDRYL